MRTCVKCIIIIILNFIVFIVDTVTLNNGINLLNSPDIK